MRDCLYGHSESYKRIIYNPSDIIGGAKEITSKVIYSIAVLVVMIILVVAIAISLSTAPEIQILPRRSAIPVDALKVMPENDSLPPILHVDLWMDPVPLPATVNTAGAEDSAFIIPNGSALYFFFTPNASVPPEEQLFDGVTGVYISHNHNGTWTEAERIILQDHGKLALDGAVFVQENLMWFASAREGYVGVNLFTAEFKDGIWSNWKYAGDKLNKDYRVGEMHISSNGKFLYFHSDRPGGKGQLDLWVTENLGGAWQPPINLEAVNTEGDEGWPFLSEDMTELWFMRTYMGSPAIYRSVYENSTWSEPQLIISQFAAEPSLDSYGNIYFIHHYVTGGKIIEADIYVAYRK